VPLPTDILGTNLVMYSVGGGKSLEQSIDEACMVLRMRPCVSNKRTPYAACDPLQKGLLSDLPHRHKVIRFRIS
jgi:hypothetical protein